MTSVHRAPHAAGDGITAPAGADATELEPRLEFAGPTPYEQYVHAATLHSLQRPRSGEPAEVAFLVVTQIMELYFGLLRHEWRCAREGLAHDDLDLAIAALRRSVPHLRGLNASWDSLARLSPAEFNRFRPYLGQGSGFQSAMYRQVTFLLGAKSAAMVRPHQDSSPTAEELERALREPSLYDEALLLLARRGLPIPSRVLRRDRTITHPPDPDVERAWTAIYAVPERDPQLCTLAEVLIDVAEEFGRWRRCHLLAAWHALGSKPGTGGSSGVAWLAKNAHQQVFPELWTAHTQRPSPAQPPRAAPPRALPPRFVLITSLLQRFFRVMGTKRQGAGVAKPQGTGVSGNVREQS